MKRILLALSFIGLGLLANSGCASLGKMPKMPWEKDDTDYKIPVKMVVTWKDAVRYNPNDPPTRGFGGRVHFYDESNRPVQVKGGFTVYGYDDSKEGGVDLERPDRKYVFRPEDLDSHYSMSKIGHSYSFWIPWDRAGGLQKDITLAPFFQTETGQVLMSEQSKHILPGVTPKTSQPESSPSDRMAATLQAVQYQREAPATPETQREEPQMRTTTINLPDTLAGRLRTTPIASPSKSNHTSISAEHTPDRTPAYFRQPGNSAPATQSPAGELHPMEGRSLHVKPGVNLQNFRPDFANATQYSEYLSQGQPTMAPQMAPGLPTGLPQTISQAPGQQIAPGSGNPLQNPQSPSTWPPGLPQTPPRWGGLSH